MQKIIDYDVLKANKSFDITIKTIELIKEGWQPCGGIAVVSSGNMIVQQFYQAVVKYEQ